MAATYGTYDHRLLYHHHLSVGLGFGIGLVLLFTAIMLTLYILNTDPTDNTIRCVFPRGPIDDSAIKIEHIEIKYTGTPKGPVEPGETKIGNPVAVADSLVPNGTTIPKQDDPSWDRGTIDPHSLGNGGTTIVPTGIDDPEPNPDTFIVVQQEPVVLRSIVPVYPEIARRSNLEGKVVVKALVGKDGRVRRAIVLNSDAEVFNQPALDAVAQFVFSPAIMSQGPVMTWIAVPFNFRLR